MGQKKYVSYRAKSVSGPAVYYMGIVDFLQNWNTRKKFERFMKIHVLRQDKQGISVMEPLPYRDRFQTKMVQIFDTDDPLGLFEERGGARSRPTSLAHSPALEGVVLNALHDAKVTSSSSLPVQVPKSTGSVNKTTASVTSQVGVDKGLELVPDGVK